MYHMYMKIHRIIYIRAIYIMYICTYACTYVYGEYMYVYQENWSPWVAQH